MDARHRDVLVAVIREYVDSTEPVGSRVLARRHFPNLSAATLRNVMADLEEMGYLVQPHTSAGRVPTDKAYRFYVESFPPPSSKGVRPGDTLPPRPSGIDGFMERTSTHLSTATTRELLRTFEQKERLADLMTELAAGEGVNVTIGEENPVAEMRECTMITSTYLYRDQVIGILGVVGPRRLPYPEVISIVNETARHVTDALSRVRQDLYLPS